MEVWFKTKNKKNSYIYIGGNVILNKDDILGIFDLDKITVFKVNRNYLSKAEKSGKIINRLEDLPKSCILCCEKFKSEDKVYLSPLLSATLFKRNSNEIFE